MRATEKVVLVLMAVPVLCSRGVYLHSAHGVLFLACPMARQIFACGFWKQTLLFFAIRAALIGVRGVRAVM